jgi:hypothetical protein
MNGWRDPKQYPDPADTSLHRWAWEFLQRNSMFKAEATIASKQQRTMKAAGTLPHSWSAQPLGVVLKRWGVLHPILPEWRPLAGDAPVRFDQAPRFVGHRESNGAWIVFAPMRQDRLVLEFDLDAPLDPQVERARHTLAANQCSKFPALRRQRNQTTKFALYLRVLDARAAGAMTKEILDVLSSQLPKTVDQRTLRYWIKSAQALRDSGYRELLKL